MPNRLSQELSPYLQQHAHNPVDWYAWGDEAIARARGEDKPILLSIGYSACHWCHVMERESFDDGATAALMNELFVSVKVDREERPDLDQIYQMVVQLMGRSGGWPLTVFLTPKLEPFFAGTYFPPVERYGMPSFQTVLRAVHEAYRERRADVERSAGTLVQGIAEVTDPSVRDGGANASALDTSFLKHVARKLTSRFDDAHGGFGGAPKFPNTMALDVLLRASARHEDAEARDRVLLALEAMRRGGIYDQLGGGFHRYSTDAHWLVPHFEKMLYDNALLAKVYTDAFRVTRAPWLEQTVRETLGYLQREMRDATGVFYATQDADSEGEEGKFFAWRPDELDALLSADDARIARAWFGVDDAGNFEHGSSVLSQPLTATEAAKELGLEESALAARLRAIRETLFQARERRPKPFRDEKVLASWNGLAISAFAHAAGALGDAELGSVARTALSAVRALLMRDDGLRRLGKAGSGPAETRAFLEDYGDLATAALDVFEQLGDASALVLARELADLALAKFEDPAQGGFFFAEATTAHLIVRAKDSYDQATPSGTSSLCHALLRLHAITDEPRYLASAERAVASYARAALDNPMGFGHLLGAMERVVFGATEVIVRGRDGDATTSALLAAAREAFLPTGVVVLSAQDDAPETLAARHRSLPARPEGAVGYLCRDRACSAPITGAAELSAVLAKRAT